MFELYGASFGANKSSLWKECYHTALLIYLILSIPKNEYLYSLENPNFLFLSKQHPKTAVRVSVNWEKSSPLLIRITFCVYFAGKRSRVYSKLSKKGFWTSTHEKERKGCSFSQCQNSAILECIFLSLFLRQREY